MPKKIDIVFHNESNYDYHFIIKELAKECKKQFTYLGENTEKYKTFSVPIENEVTIIDENGKEITKNIFYTLQFVRAARFLASSLSNLVNNLSEGIHRIKCKYRMMIKNVRLEQIKVSITTFFLNTHILKII